MDQGKDGGDEREGLVTYNDTCPNRQTFSNLDQQVDIQTPHGFSEVNRTQTGAIVSSNKSDIYRDQLTNVCQNVNSFIGNLEEQSSRISIPSTGRVFGVNNVELSDNSVSDISSMCNNVNFNTNSTQDRTQCFSNLQSVASYYSNNIPQPCVSNVSPLSQTVSSFQNINPYSSNVSMNRDWSTQNVAKYDSEKESSLVNSNKRRFLGGAVGAPAPKIKRKRPPGSDLKSLSHQTITPNLQSLVTDQKSSDTMSSRIHSDVNNFPICESNSYNKNDGFIGEGENLKTTPMSENTFVPESNTIQEPILKIPENKYLSGDSKVEQNSDQHSNCNTSSLEKSNNLLTPEGESSPDNCIATDSVPPTKPVVDYRSVENSNFEENSNINLQNSVLDTFSNIDDQSVLNSLERQNIEEVKEEKKLETADQCPESTHSQEVPSLSERESNSYQVAPFTEIYNTNILNEEEKIEKDISVHSRTEKSSSFSPLNLSEDPNNLDESYDKLKNFTSSFMHDNDLSSSNAWKIQPTEDQKSEVKDDKETQDLQEGNSLSLEESLEKIDQGDENVSAVDDKSVPVAEEVKSEEDLHSNNKKEETSEPKKEESQTACKKKDDKDMDTEKKEKPKEDKMSSDEGDTNSDGEQMKRQIRRRPGASGLSAKPKVKNLRRNIREIISDDRLEENTLAAQKEEQLRLQRLQEKRLALREYMEQQQVERLVAEVAEAAEAVTAAEAVEEVEAAALAADEVKESESDLEAKARSDDSDIVVLSSEEEDEDPKVKDDDSCAEDSEDEGLLKPKKEIKSENEESMDDDDDDDDSDQKSKGSEDSGSDSDSDVVVLSHSEEEEEETDDVNSSGAHINDEFNVPDAQERVLVNVGHPEKEEDIFLAPQLSRAVKPHQIGGIRFLYDNIVESLEQFKTSNGFGCILAHSMGLGKTLQVVSFTDIFLRHTSAKTVLIIVPINTLQNWQAEYNQWMPEERPPGIPEEVEIRLRTFRVFILNDAQKNLPARFKVINQWHEEGGVLLMGYELYRQLSLKKPKKPKKKKRRKNQFDDDVVDIEEEDKNKELLDEMQKALVRPGPDLIICDEGHRIKNAHANISQALKNIRTKRRVVLTGYPLQNNLLEYWCMVDFIRPNYLGTKTEFCNMFERPIQNGQCVDSTPQDVKIMRYRAHVLHSLLEGFVQRRGHSVLAKSLPSKQEHVLLCRMTKIQRTLYSAYMAELKVNKAVANPLKAFAICCKIWNHPDVLYNFVMRRMNEDFDLDLDEVVGKPGKNKKFGKFDMTKLNESNPPFQPNPPSNWNPSNQPILRPGVNLPPPPMNMSSSMPGMGMPTSMGHQSQMPPTMMQPNMPHPGLSAHNQDANMQQQQQQQHHGNPHPGMGMGPYGMSMYGMQHNYNMHQMPHYPWGYNQGYPPPPHPPNDPNLQHYPPSGPYGSPYAPPPYQQSLHLQQQPTPQQQQQQQQQQSQSQQQQSLPLAHHQQSLPPQGMPSYPPPMMHNSVSMGPPPAHPSLHHTGHPLNPHQNNHQMHDQNIQGLHQQSALNLSHQSNNTNLHTQQHSQEMHSHQNSHTMINQNSPGMHDQSNPNSQHRKNQNADQRDQTNQSISQNQTNQGGNLSPQDFTTGISSSSTNNFSKISPENLSSNLGENSFQSNQDGISNILNQNMKDLGLEDKSSHDSEMLESKETISSLLDTESDKDKKQSLQEDSNLISDSPSNNTSDTKNTKVEEEAKVKDEIAEKADEPKEEKGDDDEKKEEKKEESKREELTFEWAENLFKDYTPGILENSAKFQIFFKILEGTLKNGDRLLVFSQSLFTLSLLEEFLQKSFIPGSYETWSKNRTYYRLDGSTSAQEREKLINEFNINPHVYLFLVSTRAGSLGINLVGANRVVVFDASFNPCHDTQAVCRVYRYGQQKQCHIYRLVTDNSLERRIYDRQVNKQGIADRIVDEMNPEAHLSSKEISNLLVENEEDPEPDDLNGKEEMSEDDILSEIIKEKLNLFTRLPFQHESLLIDRKDKKLSNAEKRLAKRSYELEKQANISYSRPSYSTFYPKNSGSQTVMMGTKIGGIVYAKPVGTVRPMQSEMGQKIEGGGTMIHRPNILSRSQSNFPVETLAKQGVSVQQITVPKDVSIPTNSGDAKPIHLKSGQSVMVIKTQKGMYLRLSDGKIIAIRTPPEEAFGMPLNQGSVTIVPTMVNNPRPRGGRGGIVPTRRGRPPMSAQYALGQVIPKGTPKGQMAVRILRKPIMSSRGGKTYQTIAVPVSSGQGALLNKSVVITPAKSGSGQKFLKDLKISPKVQITPVPNKSKTSLSSIAGTSGLTKRLNRNNKIISAQAMALKTEEEKRKTKAVPTVKRDSENESNEEISEKTQELNSSADGDIEETKAELSKMTDGKIKETALNQTAVKDDGSPHVETLPSNESLMEVETSKELTDLQEQPTQPPQQPVQEQENSLTIADKENLNQDNRTSPIDKTCHLATNSISEEASNLNGSPSSVNMSGHICNNNNNNNTPNSVGSPIVNEKEDIFKNSSNILTPSSLENRPLPMSTSSEPITGIVKPLVHETLPLTPLQGLSNLVPPSEDGPGPPTSQSSFNISNMSSLPQSSTFSQTFPTSQPLFQPFLQQTLSTTSSSSITTTAAGSNVAHVAPQVQSSAADMTSQSSFLSSPVTSFTSAPPIHSPMHSLQSLAAPHTGTLSFSSINDSSLPQSPHTNQSISVPASSSSTSSNSLPSTTLASTPSISQANDGPLSLSNLLPSQTYSQTTSEDLLPHHSSALDYLNYSLSASTSAFRRPDFSSSLPSDIQSLLNPTPTPSQLPSSTLSSTQPTTSAAISAPGSFSAQSSAYSQYSPSYRTHAAAAASAAPTGFRTPAPMPPGYPPYSAQYGPYAGQYPNLSPHPATAAAAAQPSPMGQYGSLQNPAHPYQGYPPPPAGTGIPPYTSGLGGFGHGPYPPM